MVAERPLNQGRALRRPRDEVGGSKQFRREADRGLGLSFVLPQEPLEFGGSLGGQECGFGLHTTNSSMIIPTKQAPSSGW